MARQREHATVAMGPKDALQMDIVPFDDPSGGYNAVITAMNVFPDTYLHTVLLELTPEQSPGS